jgi:hypothetical protein
MSRAAVVRRVNVAEGLDLAANGYLERSKRPLAGLMLLLPLILAYEVGTQFFTTAALHGREQQIIAFSKMRLFFQFFGATGPHLPALAVVATLLAWHMARRDSWNVDVGTLLGMGIESLALSLPLFLFGVVLARYFPLMGMAVAHPLHAVSRGPTRDMLIMSLGAGVYEEFVFRLACFALLSFILKDMLAVDQRRAAPLIVLVSAVLFSAYHYWDTSEPFAIRIFAFRALAGVYFGVVFLLRGFGITAFTHATYDIIFTGVFAA